MVATAIIIIINITKRTENRNDGDDVSAEWRSSDAAWEIVV